MVQPIAVTIEEGGDYIAWDDWQKRPVPDHRGKLVNAVIFADGTIFDAYCGWRQMRDHGQCNCVVCRLRADDFWATG